jgi:hypothetical protein
MELNQGETSQKIVEKSSRSSPWAHHSKTYPLFHLNNFHRINRNYILLPSSPLSEKRKFTRTRGPSFSGVARQREENRIAFTPAIPHRNAAGGARVPEDLTTLWLVHSKKTITNLCASGCKEIRCGGGSARRKLLEWPQKISPTRIFRSLEIGWPTSLSSYSLERGCPGDHARRLTCHTLQGRPDCSSPCRESLH